MKKIMKMKPASLNDEALDNVTGGTYNKYIHTKIDENVMDDGTIEILYEGTDLCPVCNRYFTGYFYQQHIPGSCSVSFMCLDCINGLCD